MPDDVWRFAYGLRYARPLVGMSYLKLCVDEPRAPRAVGQRQQQHERLNMWLTLPLPRTSACHPRSSYGHPNRISFLERARSAPNNLRYNSLRSAQHPTGYHRVYVIYSAIMYRGTSFIFPAHRVRPSPPHAGSRLHRLHRPHRSHQPQTPSRMDAFRGSLGGDVDDSRTADGVHASFR